MSSNLFNKALDDIGRARDIVQFSCAVVRHSGLLRDQEEQAAFLQGAAVQFTRQFLPNWERDIREGESFGYATVSNAVSREPGGEAGMQACRAMAARVSRSTSALDDVDARALPLLALSFGRYPQLAECRDGTIRIAKFCRDNPAMLRKLDARNIALLVNGFSKWPDQPGCGEGTFAVAGEVLRRAETEGFSQFSPQNLTNLVNGFSKWPKQAECRDATSAIGTEVTYLASRAKRLSDFEPQGLANLVNGFSKWPSQAKCRKATSAIGTEVTRLAGRAKRLSDFSPQGLSNLVNGFGKYPEEQDLRQAAADIAAEIVGRAGQLNRFPHQELANLVNGFGKWPEDIDMRHATVAIAGEIVARAKELGGFTDQHLANLANGFSKWPEQTREATVSIAGEVVTRAGELNRFGYQELANLLNGFSKWPEQTREATIAIAGEIVARAGKLKEFANQELADLVNGFSKWPEQASTREAMIAIASELSCAANRLRGFPGQELAYLINGFSKWPQEPGMRQAAVAIAGEIASGADKIRGFTHQQLAILVNGFSKWPLEERNRQATAAIGGEVLRRADHPNVGLSDFAPLSLANLVNGFSKWPQEPGMRQAAVAMAGEIASRVGKIKGFSHQHLAVLVNGFGKWPQEERNRQAAVAIGEEVLRRADRPDVGLSDFTAQDLALLVNGFAKWTQEPVCYQALGEIARGLGPKGRRFGAFATPRLAMVANGLARGILQGEEAGEVAGPALLKERLQQLAHYLHYAEDRLQQADVLAIANIFKALSKAQLSDDLGVLAKPGLDRLEALRATPAFERDNNLETMGNLCAALLPLARSPRPALRWHRRPALNLLNAIQPVVERKIEAHLEAGQAERHSGANASRCPALSIYQVLKTRAVLEKLYRRPYVEGDKRALRRRQEELHAKTSQILDSARALIEADLSNMSWNLIAEIEAEGPLDALDTFMAQNAPSVQAQHAAAVFDVHGVLEAMDHEPRPPQGDAGLMRLPVVDMQGRPLAGEAELRYSIFHRLTSGAVKVVAVQLPGKPSAFMLARTLSVEGVPYRMDLFGGSKLKAPQKTLAQLAARLPDAADEATGGKLLAIPYADTAPGTAFEQLARAWAPFKEAYYYTQRRGFAAPPDIPGLGPHDYALEGAFRLSLLPDRPAGAAHPFRLAGPDGPIALRPHDGCGFIRASLAERMPAIARAVRPDGAAPVRVFGQGKRTSVPASALQHYPRNAAVAEETREKAEAWLGSREQPRLTAEELFRTVTSGHIDGPGAVAVPSGDGRLYVPTLKSETLTADGGVLVGRSPYDKPNLRPFAAGQVRSARDGDATAAFLDRCVAFQYSFNVAHKSGERLAADDPTLFAKGILIVVPDRMWPAAFAERSVVMSAEDVKCHSHWLEGKDRVKADTGLDCVGILQATEVFAPGSLVAVPSAEQKKLDGDFDGDTVVIVGDRPRLYEHVRQFDQKEQARGLASLKPPKSHTPAIENGSYQFSRSRQILSATQQVLETYSCLQRNVLAQPLEAQRWFAERAVFGTYEGIHHELRADIRVQLQAERPDGQAMQGLLERARQDGEAARHPVARELAALLVSELEAWAHQGNEEQPNGEQQPKGSLARAMASTSATAGVSAAAGALFPELAESYPAAADARERVELLLDHCRARIDPRPDGYNPHDLHESAINLLSVGIKVGTDAYKSDTGARLFMKKSADLQRLLQQVPGLKPAPYVKALAATLHQGRFDVDASLADLKDNPTLAASVMEASIKLAAANGILPSPLDVAAADDPAATITLSREQALERARSAAQRAAAEEGAITANAQAVAALLRQAGIEVTMPHLEQRLRGRDSMADGLTGQSVSAAPEAQLLTNAVRHVFEIPDAALTRAFKAAVLAFEERGCSEVETTNWFRMRTPSFLAIRTVFSTPQGYRFEVEFHTPASYQAKLANHDLYKQIGWLRRHPGPDAEQKADELVQRVKDRCLEVAIPPDASSIPHWGSSGHSRSRTAGASRLATADRASQPAAARSPQAGAIIAALGMRPVVLVGMPGSGKSTIGPELARKLGLEFVDTDKHIEARHGKLADLFQRHGEAHFRALEAEQIAGLLENGPCVIATGGGAFAQQHNRSLIGEKAVSVWLDTNPQVIRMRLRNDTSRPLLQGPDGNDKLSRMFEERTPLYQQADIRVVPPHRQDKKNAEPCVKALHAYLCGGEDEAAPTPANKAPAANEMPAATQTPLAMPTPAAAERPPTAGTSGTSGAPSAAASTAQRRRDDHRSASLRVLASSSGVVVPPGIGPIRRQAAERPQAAGLPQAAGMGQAAGPGAAAHRLALGATQWLEDDHIAADYAVLGGELHRANPDVAARTRLVEPSVAHLLRMTEDAAEAAAIFHGIAGGGANLSGRADFVFLPLNNAGVDQGGTHWSLLFVDLRGPQPLAYHYDSSGGQNSPFARQLAARLGARLEPVLMAQQDNDYDCGVFVLDATRALTARLAEAEPPTGRPLHLDTLVADRQALLDRLRPLIGSGP